VFFYKKKARGVVGLGSFAFCMDVFEFS